MQGIEQQVLYSRLEKEGSPVRKVSARIEPLVAECLGHRLAAAPVIRQSGRLRGSNHMAAGQFQPERGLSDWRLTAGIQPR